MLPEGKKFVQIQNLGCETTTKVITLKWSEFCICKKQIRIRLGKKHAGLKIKERTSCRK
jgi:hypothetical protein